MNQAALAHLAEADGQIGDQEARQVGVVGEVLGRDHAHLGVKVVGEHDAERALERDAVVPHAADEEAEGVLTLRGHQALLRAGLEVARL